MRLTKKRVELALEATKEVVKNHPEAIGILAPMLINCSNKRIKEIIHEQKE